MHGSVTIICRVHGPFEQKAYSHIQGRGCRACSYDERTERKYLTLPEVLLKFRAAHGDKYTYEHFVYQGSKVKGQIECPAHGSFWQTPDNHWNGTDCPVCGDMLRVGAHADKPAILYYARIESPAGTFWKVGVTHKTFAERTRGWPRFLRVTLLWVEDFDRMDMAIEEEMRIKMTYAADRSDIGSAIGNGWTECFSRDILGHYGLRR